MQVNSSSKSGALETSGSSSARIGGGTTPTADFASILKKLRNPPPPPPPPFVEPRLTSNHAAKDDGAVSGRQNPEAGGAGAPVTFTAAGMAKEFAKYDVDGNGRLSRDEFVALDDVVMQGRPTLKEAASGRVVDGSYVFDVIDRGNSGSISLNQLLARQYGQN